MTISDDETEAAPRDATPRDEQPDEPAHLVSFKITDPKTGNFEKYQFDVSTTDHTRLRRFVELADKLRHTPLVAADIPSGFSVSGEPGKPLRAQALLPHDDALATSLHRLRPFVLVKSPMHYFNVGGIFAKQGTKDSLLRRAFKQKNRLFAVDDSLAELGFKIEVEPHNVVSEEFFLIWLYRQEYHPDEDAEKLAAYDAVTKAFPVHALQALMMELLRRKVQAILWLADLCRLALTKRPQEDAPGAEGS